MVTKSNSRSQKPRCGKGQSCGMTCIQASDTCQEKLTDEATKSLGAKLIDQVTKSAKDLAQSSGSGSDAGKSYEELDAKYPNAKGLENINTDLGNGVSRWDITIPSADGSGDKLTYSVIDVKDKDGNVKSFTVSDGLIKEVTAAKSDAKWDEARQAALRSKIGTVESEIATKVPAAELPKEIKANESNEVSYSSPHTLLDKSKIHSDLPALASDESLQVSKGTQGRDNAIADLKAADPTLSDEDAFNLATGLRGWSGSNYFKQMSPLTYSEKKITPKLRDAANTLSNAQQALERLPGFKLEDFPTVGNSDNPAKLNRFIKIKNPAELVANYKPGSVIQENGMFGTTTNQTLSFEFAEKANIQFTVNSITDGSGRGVAVDKYKSGQVENEVLYKPGTKFRVDKVEGGFTSTKEDKDAYAKLSDDSDRAKFVEDRGGSPYLISKEDGTRLTPIRQTRAELDNMLIEANKFANGEELDINKMKEFVTSHLGLTEAVNRADLYVVAKKLVDGYDSTNKVITDSTFTPSLPKDGSKVIITLTELKSNYG